MKILAVQVSCCSSDQALALGVAYGTAGSACERGVLASSSQEQVGWTSLAPLGLFLSAFVPSGAVLGLLLTGLGVALCIAASGIEKP